MIMTKSRPIAILALLVLTCVAYAQTKMPSVATWKDYEGSWIGYDPGTGAFFHRLTLADDKTGSCVVLLSEDNALLYKVTVSSWDEGWNITLRFDPLPGTDDKPFSMERVDGVGLTLRETGVEKPNRAREVQLVREAILYRDIDRAKLQAEKNLIEQPLSPR